MASTAELIKAAERLEYNAVMMLKEATAIREGLASTADTITMPALSKTKAKTTITQADIQKVLSRLNKNIKVKPQKKPEK